MATSTGIGNVFTPFINAENFAHAKEVAELLQWMANLIIDSGSLQLEIRFFYRMIYRIWVPHRNDKQFHILKMIKKYLGKLLAMTIFEEARRLRQEITEFIISGAADNRPTKKDCLSAKEEFCRLLTGTQEMAAVLTRILVYAENAYLHIHHTLKRGHFIQLSILLISTISRLWVYVRTMLIQTVDFYQKILPFFQNLKDSLAMPSMEACNLPSNLQEWLGPENRRYFMPSIKDAIASENEFLGAPASTDSSHRFNICLEDRMDATAESFPESSSTKCSPDPVENIVVEECQEPVLTAKKKKTKKGGFLTFAAVRNFYRSELAQRKKGQPSLTSHFTKSQWTTFRKYLKDVLCNSDNHGLSVVSKALGQWLANPRKMRKTALQNKLKNIVSKRVCKRGSKINQVNCEQKTTVPLVSNSRSGSGNRRGKKGRCKK